MTECAVCMEPLRNGDPVALTNCEHLFHTDPCILASINGRWNRPCPICRDRVENIRDVTDIVGRFNGADDDLRQFVIDNAGAVPETDVDGMRAQMRAASANVQRQAQAERDRQRENPDFGRRRVQVQPQDLGFDNMEEIVDVLREANPRHYVDVDRGARRVTVRPTVCGAISGGFTAMITIAKKIVQFVFAVFKAIVLGIVNGVMLALDCVLRTVTCNRAKMPEPCFR